MGGQLPFRQECWFCEEEKAVIKKAGVNLFKDVLY